MNKTRGNKPKKAKKPAVEKGAVAVLEPGQSGQVLEGQKTRSPEGWVSTDEAKVGFLQYFSDNLVTIKDACLVLRIGRATLYEWIRDDPEFKAAFDEAEEDQKQVALAGLFDLVKQKDGPSLRFFIERRIPGWQQKQTLQHVTDTRTLEDIIDDDNASNTPTKDRGITENPQQKEGDRSLPVEPSATVLLGTEDAPQRDLESPAEGVE